MTASRGWRPRVAPPPSRPPPNRRMSQNASASRASTMITNRKTLRPVCPSPNTVSNITPPPVSPVPASPPMVNAAAPTARRSGSIGLVLLFALLVPAAGAFLIGRAKAEPYTVALVAVLATLSVFLLFAFAAGILRMPGRTAKRPLLAAIVDHASEGIVVTNPDGRVVYANAAYLELV